MRSMGSSAFLQSGFYCFSPSSSYQSPLFYPSYRKIARKKRASVSSSFWDSGGPLDVYYPFHDKVIHLVDVSAYPFSQLRDVAGEEPAEEIGTSMYEFQGSKLEESHIETSDRMKKGVFEQRKLDLEIESQDSKDAGYVEAQTSEIKKLEIPSQQLMHITVVIGDAKNTRSRISLASFLNGIGIIGSGVLGALFTTSQLAKKVLESTIDSVHKNNQLIATALMKEHKRQIRNLKDDEEFPSGQLTSSKDAVAALGSEQQDEQIFDVKLLAQKDQHEHSSAHASEDTLRKNTDRITSSLDKFYLALSAADKKAKSVCNLERGSDNENLGSSMEQAMENHVERDNTNVLLEKEGSQDLFFAPTAVVSCTIKEQREAKTAYEEVIMSSCTIKEQREVKTAYEEVIMSKNFSAELESAGAQEPVSVFDELKTVVEEHKSLKRELTEAYRKAETTESQLEEEKRKVAIMNKELETLHKQILRDSESRNILEADLDDATRSLDEMNKSALWLSRELENAKSRCAGLEAEKEILCSSLIEQKNLAKNAHEDIMDAQNFIIRLGSEREKLEKRSETLEEELAAAKGEILRLRRKISTGQEYLAEHHSKSNEAPAGSTFSVKRKTSGRRKKSSPGSDFSR